MPLESFTTPGGRKARLYIRPDTNDHNTAWSCLNEDEYRLPRVSGVAWDIGAHIGAASVALLLDNPDLRVVAIEPVPANVKTASANFWMNRVQDRVTLILGAVGAPDETETQLYHNFRGSEIATHHAFIGSTANGNNADLWRQSTDHDTTTVPAYSYSALRDDHGAPALIKIDCEGAEYAFLSDPAVAEVPLILGEWHNVPKPDGTLRTRADITSLLPAHDVTFTGPEAGPGGFRAVLR